MEKCLLAKFFTLCRCEKPKKAYSAPMDGHRVFLDFRIAKKKKKNRALLLAVVLYWGKKKDHKLRPLCRFQSLSSEPLLHTTVVNTPLLLQCPVYMHICIPHCIDTSIVNALSKIITFALYFLQA